MVEARLAYETCVVLRGIGNHGGWVGYVRTARGLDGLFFSDGDAPDGRLELIHLDHDGRPFDEPVVRLDVGSNAICWVPTAFERALAICAPEDAHLGPNTRYEMRLFAWGPPQTLTVIDAPAVVGMPTVSYVTLPQGVVGVLVAGIESLVWIELRDGRFLSAETLTPSPSQTAGGPAVFVGVDGGRWVIHADDFRQICATRYENGAPAEVRTLTRRFGKNQEVSAPDVLVGLDGPFVVYHRNNGRRRAEQRDLLIEAVPWSATGSVPVRVLGDHEVSRFGTAQGCGHALIVWEHGLSKRERATFEATIRSPTDVSAPAYLDMPFPEFIVPFDDHAVLLAKSQGNLLSKRVDMDVRR